MRLFCKYKVGDKVLIRYQNKTRVGHIVKIFHPGKFGIYYFLRGKSYKYITIEDTNGRWHLPYGFHKKNIIKRLK